MATSSADLPPPSTSEPTSEAVLPTDARVSSDSGPPADSTTALTIGNSVKRCLRDASLAHSRLEILSLLDFKPLYSGGSATLAGELFDLRIAERNADLESVVTALQNVQGLGSYTSAVNKYESAVVATESDFALMKLLLLLQKYATHTSRFMPFLEEYTQTGNFDVSFLGDTTVEKLEAACSVNLRSVINEDAATQILLQAIASLNCCVYGISPYRLAVDYRANLSLNEVLTGVEPRDTDFINALYGTTFISRDLTFSREMLRIANEEEPDPTFQELVETLLGSNFATSPREISDVLLTPIAGTSSYSNLRTSMSRQNQKITRVTDLLKNKKGIIGSLRYSDNNRILLPEKSEIQYNAMQYEFEPIDPLVDEAFSGANVLDFTNYSAAVDDMTTAIDNSMLFLKTGFRVLESADDSDGAKSSIGLVSSEQPLSAPAVAATIFDVFNRRFASTLNTSLMTEFYDWQTPEHVNYTKVLAWLFIRDNPDRAKKVVNALLKDYDGGYLTALAVPEPIEGTAEVNDDGEEIAGTEQMTELVNVKPGTETRVTLGGGAALNNQVKRIGTYYADDVPNMSPSNVLSKNPGEGLSKPEIRTNSNRIKAELHEYFGSPNTDLAGDPDLRLINVISMYQERYSVHSDVEFNGLWWEETESTRTLTGSSNYYYSSKIIAAEIIDAVLEVVRLLVSAFAEVEAVEDGDPVFPFLDQLKGPYGDDNAVWGYSGSGYDSFAFNQWVNTILTFDNTFTRSIDKVTYFRRVELNDMCDKILDIFGYLMLQYGFLQARSETIDDGVGVPLAGAMKINWPVCATVRFNERDYNSIMTGYGQAVQGANNADGNEGIKEHITLLSEMLSELLNSSFDSWEEDVDDIRESLPADGSAGTKDTTTKAGSPASATGDFAPAPSTGNLVPEEPLTLTALSAFSEFLLATKEEDAVLSFLCDFIGGYSTRVNNYKTATMDLVEGEGAPMGELINNLRSAGDAGEDTLQNMSSNQMSLKQIAIKEEAGDPENGYLPKLSILTDAEIESVKVMCNENILKSPEGDTTRVVVVGIPVGSFDRNNIESEFCIRVSYRDIEYPQLVFRSKSYKFDKDLYVLPEDLEAASVTSSDLDDVIDSMKFSRLTVKVTESSDESAEIQLSDDIQQIDVDNGNRQVYNNIAVSELLKLYYRIMVGLNYSEIAFNSTPEGLVIPISDGSSDLAATMASQIESLGTFSANLAANVNDLVSDLPTFENVDDFVGGDITPVDEALLGDLKNAYQSRLFSPETFRSRALGAKMFDRVYAIPVDPDEFYIVAPGESQVGTDDFDVETPQNILDFYLEKGIVEETGLAAPFAYKLAPRKTAEGSMAFGSVSLSMTSVDDDSEEMLG